MSLSSDRLFAQPLREIGEFAFDARVAAVFADMINRSVPGYATLVPLFGILGAPYLQAGGRGYDLGCSLGACMLALASRLEAEHPPPPEVELIGIDSSADMLARARQMCAPAPPWLQLQLIEADVRNHPLEPCALVIAAFTLQFLPLADREPLLREVFAALRPGGALLLAEKVHLEDRPAEERLRTDHERFKRAMGYSGLEIARKRSALEGVLVTDQPGQIEARLRQIGFDPVLPVFQCLQFRAWLAERPASAATALGP